MKNNCMKKLHESYDLKTSNFETFATFYQVVVVKIAKITIFACQLIKMSNISKSLDGL